MLKLIIFVLALLAVDHVFGRRSRQLPGPPAPEWKQWAVFFFVLISTYATFFFCRTPR